MSAAERLNGNPERVVELGPGGEPVLLTVFNKRWAVLVPCSEFMALSSPRVDESSDEPLVRLDGLAFALAKKEAKKRNLRVSDVVSESVRKALG